MGRQPDAEGAAEQMRKRRDRGHKRGRLWAPQGVQKLDPSQCHPRGPRLSYHPRSSRASWGPVGRSCLCADPGGGGGPQASKAAQRAPESARRAPAPPSGCPLLPSAARSLFPPGARARGGSLVPGGAQAGAARYLRVFVKQS